MKLPEYLKIALQEIGQKEMLGAEHNPRIIEYHSATTLKATSDETPWCSSFVNWCVNQAGLKGTGSARARSWMFWGREAKAHERIGSIAILERPTANDPASAHVGFVWYIDDDQLILFGGNQGDQVRFSVFKRSGILGMRVYEDVAIT
jgi:uncharacterized protein (TIGR02594 family)